MRGYGYCWPRCTSKVRPPHHPTFPPFFLTPCDHSHFGVFALRVFCAKCVEHCTRFIENKQTKTYTKMYSQQLHLKRHPNGCTNTHAQTIRLTLPLQQVDGDIYANRVKALHHVSQVPPPLTPLFFPISHFNCNSGRTECYCTIIEKPVASLFSAIVCGQSPNIVRD